MTEKELVRWLESLKKEIGKAENRTLWHYAEALDMAIEALHKTEWIPVSEKLPKEHEWVGTKLFGTTKSDTILMTFDVDGTKFVKPLSLQNGKLSRPDAQTMDVFHKGWKMLAWRPLPEPYRKDCHCESRQKTGKWIKTKYGYTWKENNVCLNFVDYYEAKEEGE